MRIHLLKSIRYFNIIFLFLSFQIYLCLKKNRTLRPEDEAKYGLYGKLALINNPLSEPLFPMKKFKQAIAISNNYNLNNNIISGDQNLNNVNNNANNNVSNGNTANTNSSNNNNVSNNVNNNNCNNLPKTNEIASQVNIFLSYGY